MKSQVNFTLKSGIYDLHYFTGEVMDAQTRTETHVHGGGGQNNTAVRISSTSTKHDTLFLKDSNGNEESFELINSDAKVRKGNTATIFWAIRQDAEKGPVVAVYNQSTKELNNLPNNKIATEKVIIFHSGIGCLGPVILGIISVYLGIKFESVIVVLAILFVPLIFWHIAYKKTIASHHSTINSSIADLMKKLALKN